MPREVRQVRDALQSEFGGLIDMSDENGSPDKVEQHFLSRALAALVTRKLLGSDRDAAVDALVIAVTTAALTLSPWPTAGRASG
jgi:hypothetical protein